MTFYMTVKETAETKCSSAPPTVEGACQIHLCLSMNEREYPVV